MHQKKYSTCKSSNPSQQNIQPTMFKYHVHLKTTANRKMTGTLQQKIE